MQMPFRSQDHAPVAVDLDKIRDELNAAAPMPTREPRERDYAPLQLIAHAITKLTWREAVTMGKAIAAKGTDGNNSGDLTAALIAWAEDWENFDTRE
jgi:hypothetical protein